MHFNELYCWGVNEENHAAAAAGPVCGLESDDRSDGAALMNGPTWCEAPSCHRHNECLAGRVLMLTSNMRSR